MRTHLAAPACRWILAVLLIAGLALPACENANTREAPQRQLPEAAKASVTSSSVPSMAPTPAPPPTDDDFVEVFDGAKGAWKKVRGREVPSETPFVHAGRVLQYRGSLRAVERIAELSPSDLAKPTATPPSEEASGPEGFAHRKDNNGVDFDLSNGRGEHRVWLSLPRTQDVKVLPSDSSHSEWVIAKVAELKSGDRVRMATGEIALVLTNEKVPDQSVPRGQVIVIGKSERLTGTLLEVRTTREVVTTTPEHPFEVDGKGWTEAQKLQPGDALNGLSDGKRIEVVSVALRRVSPPQKVYNLETWPDHTFRVGKEGLLVHNGTCVTSPAATGGEPTRFINGVRVVDRRAGTVLEGTVDLKPTLDRIASGGRFPHRNDGAIFQNRPLPGRTAPELPAQAPGYYREYVHPTVGVSGPGPQRVVIGQGGEMFYTPDHYQTFIPLQ
jgi:guanyl-specific ribonuclease Sa